MLFYHGNTVLLRLAPLRNSFTLQRVKPRRMIGGSSQLLIRLVREGGGVLMYMYRLICLFSTLLSCIHDDVSPSPCDPLTVLDAV